MTAPAPNDRGHHLDQSHRFSQQTILSRLLGHQELLKYQGFCFPLPPFLQRAKTQDERPAPQICSVGLTECESSLRSTLCLLLQHISS